MELIKNIYFNTDRLTPFIKVKISYTGKFFDNASEKVFLHYGFSNSWENSAEIEMTKSEIGYQAEIELLDYDTFNICFHNNKNEWDNNDGNNYIFLIEKADLSLISIDEDYSIIAPRKLRRLYLWKKKIRIHIYKVLTFLPRLYSRKI